MATRRLEQALNKMTAEFGVEAESVDEKPTYESIAAKLTKVESGLAILIEKLDPPPENGNEA